MGAVGVLIGTILTWLKHAFCDGHHRKIDFVVLVGPEPNPEHHITIAPSRAEATARFGDLCVLSSDGVAPSWSATVLALRLSRTMPLAQQRLSGEAERFGQAMESALPVNFLMTIATA
jgi:hypothetical protein